MVETTLTILDGYPVQIHPGDRYAHAHLFVRGTYVHPIIFADNGQVFLKDAAAFDGPRTTLMPDEIIALRTLYATVHEDYATRQAAKEADRARRAGRIQARQQSKLAGMDDVKLYD